jgi:hypothetical protein
MSSLAKLLAGLGLAGVLCLPVPASASPGAPAAAAAKAFRMVKGADHPTITRGFRAKMADVIEGAGPHAAHGPDTPEMRIVPMAGALIKTKQAASEINEHDISGPGAEFAFHGAAQKTRFKLLIPVSAHYGLPYKQYAASNEYAVEVKDPAGKVVYTTVVKSVGHGKPVAQIGREDLVTEHEIELPFDAAKEFKVSFWPTATSKYGYTAGREVTVRLAN